MPGCISLHATQADGVEYQNTRKIVLVDMLREPSHSTLPIGYHTFPVSPLTLDNWQLFLHRLIVHSHKNPSLWPDHFGSPTEAVEVGSIHQLLLTNTTGMCLHSGHTRGLERTILCPQGGGPGISKRSERDWTQLWGDKMPGQSGNHYDRHNPTLDRQKWHSRRESWWVSQKGKRDLKGLKECNIDNTSKRTLVWAALWMVFLPSLSNVC